MCDNENGAKNKGDDDMAMVKNKVLGEKSEKISREELRSKLIRETIKENRAALEKLSRN